MGELNYPEETRGVPRTAKSEKGVCELPLIGAPQGQQNGWIEGANLVQMGSGVLAVNRQSGLCPGQL